MNIILSIHPKWAKLIYEGKKTIEWRKTIPHRMDSVKLRDGNPDVKVYLYETAPLRLITGFFYWGGVTICDARGMKEDNPRLIAGQVGIEELQKYQGENCNICAWHIDKPVMIKGIYHIKDFGLKRPPQSWCYTEVEK